MCPACHPVFVLPRPSSSSSSPHRIFLYIGHHPLKDVVSYFCLGPSRDVASLALVTGSLPVSSSPYCLADCALQSVASLSVVPAVSSSLLRGLAIGHPALSFLYSSLRRCLAPRARSTSLLPEVCCVVSCPVLSGRGSRRSALPRILGFFAFSAHCPCWIH